MTVECVSKWREGSIPSMMGGQQKLRIVGRNPLSGVQARQGLQVRNGPSSIPWLASFGSRRNKVV
jgi:hypothetical protein